MSHDNNPANRLKEILARKAELERAASAEAARKKAEADASELEKGKARERWKSSIGQIREAIADLAAEMSASGLAFEFDEGKRPDTPAIAQASIVLREGSDQKEKKIVLNVNAFGLVHPVFLIPHSGKHPNDFNISEATKETYTNLMLTFLDQVFSPKSR